MSRASDIDRIFAHIGSTDMKYQEFDPPPDPEEARANWSLLHSATRRGEVDAAIEPARPAAPEQRIDAFRERVAERIAHPTEAPAVDSETAAPPQPSAGPAVESEVPRRPLQQVFARLGGRNAAAARPERPPTPSSTPLSQVFKRLS